MLCDGYSHCACIICTNSENKGKKDLLILSPLSKQIYLQYHDCSAVISLSEKTHLGLKKGKRCTIIGSIVFFFSRRSRPICVFSYTRTQSLYERHEIVNTRGGTVLGSQVQSPLEVNFLLDLICSSLRSNLQKYPHCHYCVITENTIGHMLPNLTRTFT